ncbi:MAG TPA: nitroreductase family protein [Myxococcota bacterium]|nr:nitroreductase family protein [Myxococcales bacterium]HPG25835.1 nitroreductase family protein [Myxococcota bacterium]
MLDLTPDELLTTTRAVRKRLDFDRKVPRELIEECLQIAFQAPNGGNMNTWRWVVIDDPALIAKTAEIYNGGLDDYIASFGDAGYPGAAVPGADRIDSSVAHLRENWHRLPAVLLPMFAGRTDGLNLFHQASLWGSCLQAVWSFMLALRARGLGSAWTTGHLYREKDMAELLGIPPFYTQVGLFPIAYTIGTDFKPGYRKPTDEVVGWNGMPKG